MRDLGREAARLRELHGRPLLLANAWDVASARASVAAGMAVVATSSAAVAAAAGEADADVLSPEVAFAAVARIAGAVDVPVTADLEAGYGLSAPALVERLLGAGAVGCNLEDTDHHGSTPLVRAERQAEWLAEVRAAALRAGVPVVVNARVDTYLRQLGSPDDQLAEALSRGRLYREAGADCVYPIGVQDEDHIRRLVAELGTVNVLLRPGGMNLKRLTELGVARISLGPGAFRLAMDSVAKAAGDLLAGRDPWA